MKKVLITGATGLIGKSLLSVLQSKKEYKIYAITTDENKLNKYENINVVEGDLKSSDFRKRVIEEIIPDVIIHLAWDQTTSDFRRSNENLKWLEISIDLLYRFIENNGKRFIFAGSSSEYDAQTGTFSEKSLAKAASKYGQCKRCFTELAQNYCSDKCSFVSLRYFTVFGENDTHSFGAIPQMIRMLKNSEEVVCNSPLTTRDYIYADDAAFITYKMIDNPFEGILNVATGTPYKMADIFRIIGEAMGKEELVKINWNNHRTDADYKKYIKYITTYNITDSNISISFFSSCNICN